MGILDDAWGGIKSLGQDLIDINVKGFEFMVNPFGITERVASQAWSWVKHQLIPDMRRDREAMVSIATASRRVIYGRTRVGGSLVYAETSGDKDQNLNILVVFAGHAIDGYEELWFNDQLLAKASTGWAIESQFANYAQIELHDGTQTTASTQMTERTHGAWTADHKLLGCAYVFITMYYDEAKYASGIPTVKAVIKGKKVYDPRTGLTAWSDNPALCIRDYMLLDVINGGMGCATTEVDDAAITAAANICDQTISGAGGEKRYTLNGFITLDGTPAAIVKSMLSAMAGQALYSGGVWKLYAGAAYSSVATLDESWLNGGITFTTGANKNDRINTVKGMFTNPADAWADTEFPAVVNDTYLADDGEELTMDMSLPFCTSQTLAQRLAKIELQKSRFGMAINYPCNMKAAVLNALDVVAINNTLLGWSGKLFRIMSWEFSAMGGVNLSLVEDDASIWADPTTYGSLTPPALTYLPNPRTVTAPTSFTVTEELYTTVALAATKSRLVLAWVSAQAQGTLYDISFDGVVIQTVTDTTYTINDVKPGTYDVSVRAKNTLGAVSSWVTIAKTVQGKTDAPAAVSGFTAAFAGDLVKLNWTANTETDLAGYEIRTGANWAAGTLIQKITANGYSFRPTASGATTYWIAAFDTAGNYGTESSAAATVPAALTPTAITATGKFLGIDLDITYDKTRLDTAYLEIYAGTTNNRAAGTTVQVGVTKNGKWSHEGLGNGDVRYYWTRAVTVFGETGAWYPSSATGGTQGTALNDPSKVITLLNSNTDSGALASYLAGGIPLLKLFDVGSGAFTAAAADSTAAATVLYGFDRAARAVLQQSPQIAAVATTVVTHTGDLAALNATVAGLISNDWSAGTVYTPNQYVRYTDGIVYRCILTTTAGIVPTNTTYWKPASTLLTLLSDVQQNIDDLNGVVATKVSTTTYNTKVGELEAATSAVDQRADVIDAKVKATTIAFLGGEEFDPTRRYVTNDVVVVTNLTTGATLQYQCSADLPNPPTGTYPASDGAHWTLVTSTGRMVTAESRITQTESDITLSAQTIVGPLAFLAEAADNTASIFAIGDIPEGLNTRVSTTAIKLNSVDDKINIQASRVDTANGRISAAEIAIDGANAEILLRATKGELTSSITVLSDLIGISLSAPGATYTPGMTLTWTDSSHTKSLLRVNTDTFQVGKTDSTGYRSIFTVGTTAAGASTVGIDGALVVDGTISARMLNADSAMITWLNARNIVAGEVAAENITGTTIAGKTISGGTIVGGTVTGATVQTKADPGTGDRSRFVVSTSNNSALFFDSNNLEVVNIGSGQLGTYSCYGDFGDAAAGAGSLDPVIGIISRARRGFGIVSMVGNIGDTETFWYGADIQCNAGTGVNAYGSTYGAIFDGLVSPLQLKPVGSSSTPSHYAGRGSFWVTGDDRLFFRKNSGWVQII